MSRQITISSAQIDPSVYIAKGAVVLGDVAIGSESSVWFNAVIRGDTAPISIGKRCNIQDGCVLHADPGIPCTLADGVTVGHLAIVHGATVGDNVIIGMHAVVMNGAEIGADSIVAVGAIVTEGTKIPPGSLAVGIPARALRPLRPDEIERNRLTASHYVEAAQQYRAAETLPPPSSSP